MADKNCECIGCYLRQVLHEKHPHGYNGEQVGELLRGIADIAGEFLAVQDDDATPVFKSWVDDFIEHYKASPQHDGVLHS